LTTSSQNEGSSGVYCIYAGAISAETNTREQSRAGRNIDTVVEQRARKNNKKLLHGMMRCLYVRALLMNEKYADEEQIKMMMMRMIRRRLGKKEV
jgi:hypothetical protein